MFGRRKYVQNDLVSPAAQRLIQLATEGKDPDIILICKRFVAFKQQYRGDYVQYLIKIEDAISVAIHDCSAGSLFDIMVLKHSLDAILQMYTSERRPQRTLKNSTIVKFLVSLIEAINTAISSPRYSQYQPDNIRKYQDSISTIVRQYPNESESFLFSIARMFDRWCGDYQEINHSLVTRKLMFSIGEKIHHTLTEKMARNNRKSRYAPYKGYTLDLFHSLNVILNDYLSFYKNDEAHVEGYGQCYRMIREDVIVLNREIIYPKHLKIMQSFVNEHPLSDSNLKRIAQNFLRYFPNTDVDPESDQSWIEKIRGVIVHSIIEFNNGRDYFEETVLIDALQAIVNAGIESQEILEFLNRNINYQTNDPLYYQDWFYMSIKNDQKILSGQAFQQDILRSAGNLVFSGKLVSPTLSDFQRQSDAGQQFTLDQLCDFVKEHLFHDILDERLRDELVKLFYRHTHATGCNHSTTWPCFYLNSFLASLPSEENQFLLPSVLQTINDRGRDRVCKKLFYTLKNGYGVILTSYLQRVGDHKDVVRGDIAMGYELTLDSHNPNADHFNIRCTGLRCRLEKNGIDFLGERLLNKIEEKANLIFPWQRVDLDVSVFAYNVAINAEENPAGHELQETAKAFCAALRENYSAPNPDITKVDEMNRIASSIKEAILTQAQAFRRDFHHRSEGLFVSHAAATETKSANDTSANYR